MSKENLVAMADSFMAIFGYRRIATMDGNVIAPREFEKRCVAKQYSDMMSCECGLRWDTNDSHPPRCPNMRNNL